MPTREARKLHDLISCRHLEEVTAEINDIVALMAVDIDATLLRTAQADIEKLFGGEYPGYQASNTAYHNLEHTFAVVLAMASVLHGLQLEGSAVTGRELLLGVLAAMFHDTGLIQRLDETEGSGARFTVGHEERSLHLAAHYLGEKGLSAEEIEDCAQMIRATTLSRDIDDISFRSERVKLLAKSLAAADLLAQMADRTYLEKLPLLYREFSEAGLTGFESALDLIKKTNNFYSGVALPRLHGQFSDLEQVLRAHFRVRWRIDRDLYSEAIASNFSYLESLLDECGDTYACYLKKLHRGGISTRIQNEGLDD